VSLGEMKTIASTILAKAKVKISLSITVGAELLILDKIIENSFPLGPGAEIFE
jgi:hypothetical protein